MAGTHSLGYYLKDRIKVIANDVMKYSFLIGKAIVESSISKLDELKIENSSDYNFFESNYSDTYFALKQCRDLDAIKYSIEKLDDDYLKACYYACVFNILDRVASTAGHFDGYLDPNNVKAKNRKNKSVIKYFEREVRNFRNKPNKFNSIVYNLEALDLLKEIDYIDTIYIDPPYNHRQYSTLYHILEMFAIYTGEILDVRSKYPRDRYVSPYCKKKRAFNAFKELLDLASEKTTNIIFSYFNNGLLKLKDLMPLFADYSKSIKVERINYTHRKQKTSRGNGDVIEYIFCLKN